MLKRNCAKTSRTRNLPWRFSNRRWAARLSPPSCWPPAVTSWQNAQGLPHIEADATRSLIIGHLAQALPAREAGAEVSLAIAGVAADSLSQMIPGLLGGGQAQGMLNGQRERLMQQIGNDLNNTLLYVYRDLSDPELEEFATFAESPEGRAYYKAALAAIRAGLAVGQSTSSLAQ